MLDALFHLFARLKGDHKLGRYVDPSSRARITRFTGRPLFHLKDTKIA
jgi:hypothetical protein